MESFHECQLRMGFYARQITESNICLIFSAGYLRVSEGKFFVTINDTDYQGNFGDYIIMTATDRIVEIISSAEFKATYEFTQKEGYYV